MGYAFYFAPLLSGLNAIMLVYFVAGDKVFLIHDTFPHFAYFVIFAISIGVPIFVAIGYRHYKKNAYGSEQDVLQKNNPYHYKLPPGFVREVNYPLQIELIDFLIENSRLSPEKLRHLEEIRSKAEFLVEGGRLNEYGS